MALTVPAAMEHVLQEGDATGAALDEVPFAGLLVQAAPEAAMITADERRGAFAEIAAWRFSRPHGGTAAREREPWGIYWAPLMGGTYADGRTFHQPDVAEVDEEVLSHWITRASRLQHPMLRARYADLSWEIGRYLKRPSREGSDALISLDIPVTLGHAAIDAYLEAVERRLADDEYDAWVFTDRAIGLSLSLKDKPRIARAKTTLFAYYREKAREGGKFHWARLNDLTEDRAKALELTEEEQSEIVRSLEQALSIHSDIVNRDLFDPHQATDAADRLVKRLAGNVEEVRRVVKVAGAAFEQIAKDASGILAVAWLEDLIPRYRNVGLIDDSARVERAIRDRAEQARGEMKTISVPLEIPREKMDAWADAVIGSTLQEALGKIALHCMARDDGARKTVQEMVDKAPLMAMMPAAIMGADGFTAAMIQGVEDDLEGRSIQHAADSFNWNAPFLYFALNRAKEKYGFDLGAIVAYLNGAPFFAPSREALLREGLAAWLGEDPVKAIHVLVPQMEAACRDLLAGLGAPVMKPDPQSGGFEVIGLGAVLNHPAFRAGVPKDIRFHLRALYSDPRGINLRNHLAHGMAHIGLFGMGLANWVVHSLLLLAILRMKTRPAGGAAGKGDEMP